MSPRTSWTKLAAAAFRDGWGAAGLVLFAAHCLAVHGKAGEPVGNHPSWRVGRNRISLMSTSSGWLMAKTTARANESGEIASSS